MTLFKLIHTPARVKGPSISSLVWIECKLQSSAPCDVCKTKKQKQVQTYDKPWGRSKNGDIGFHGALTRMASVTYFNEAFRESP